MSTPRRPAGNERRRPRTKSGFRWLAYLFLIMFGLFLGGVGLAATLVYKAYSTLPAYEDFDPSLTSTIYDSKGHKVYELAAAENRTLVKLKDIPKEIRDALIATEDARFYSHFGIDVWRIGGAVWADTKYFLGLKGSRIEGASTITMQLSRNAFLTLEQSFMRKLQESLIAIQLERRFTKDEILEKYLNQVSFGRQAAGIQAAAQTFFSKNAQDLTLSEGAMLIGMLQANTDYDPFNNYEAALRRRSVVLDQMVKYGYLSAERAAQVKKERPQPKLAQLTPTSVTFTGDWYVDYVISILTDNPTGTSSRYGTPTFDPDDLYRKGLKIYTALDLDYQKTAEAKLKEILPERTQYYGSKEVPEGAVVMVNHQTGEVKALVGGLNHKQMLGYNRATQAYRQPGSAIKPLVSYLPAIDLLGWGPATVIDDSPPRLSHPDRKHVWPENYEFHYSGLKPMRFAVEQSINSMAVRTLEAVTPRKGIEYARKLGLSTIVDASMGPQNDENLALALGGLTTGVTPLEMTSAYGVLGNLGMRVDPVIITMIKNKHGEIIYQASPHKQQVVPKESVWLMVDIMKGSILRGTASWESKGFNGWPAAGKTGTTEDWHDAWFIGFTSELVTGVWTGYDNEGERKSLPGRPGERWTGAGPPTRIWTAIMNELVKAKPPDWERPSNLSWVEVCKTSGMLPGPLCPTDDIGGDWFRKGKEPTQIDQIWKMTRVVKQPFINSATNKQVIDSATGKSVQRYYLWREGCGTPEDLLMIKRPTTYVQHPTDPWNFERYWPADWWREVPTEYCRAAASTPSTPPPSNQPPSSQPPSNQPPVTSPPTTPPPSDQPPVTKPPSGQPPVTPPPITLPPSTQPPTTEPPVTQPPVHSPP